MSEPLTWAVLQKFKAQIETISVENGFYTDIGSLVSLDAFRAHDLKKGELVRVVSPSDESSDADQGKSRTGPRTINGTMQVVVEYVIPTARADAQRQAHRGRADLIRVIRDNPILWGPGIRTVAITGRQTLEEPDGLAAVVVQISVTVGIHEKTPPPPAA